MCSLIFSPGGVYSVGKSFPLYSVRKSFIPQKLGMFARKEKTCLFMANFSFFPLVKVQILEKYFSGFLTKNFLENQKFDHKNSS